jgi:hypothetical protein
MVRLGQKVKKIASIGAKIGGVAAAFAIGSKMSDTGGGQTSQLPVEQPAWVGDLPSEQRGGDPFAQPDDPYGMFG